MNIIVEKTKKYLKTRHVGFRLLGEACPPRSRQPNLVVQVLQRWVGRDHPARRGEEINHGVHAHSVFFG